MEFSVMLKRENLKLPTCYVTYVLRHSPGEHQGAEFLLLKEESSTFQLIFMSWNCCEEIYGGFEGKGKKKKVCSHMHLHARCRFACCLLNCHVAGLRCQH